MNVMARKRAIARVYLVHHLVAQPADIEELRYGGRQVNRELAGVGVVAYDLLETKRDSITI